MVSCGACGNEIPVGETAYEVVKSEVEVDGIVRSSDPGDTYVLCESCFNTLLEEEDEDS